MLDCKREKKNNQIIKKKVMNLEKKKTLNKGFPSPVVFSSLTF